MKNVLERVQYFMNGSEAKDFCHELVVTDCKIKQERSRAAKRISFNDQAFCYEEAVFAVKNEPNRMEFSWGYGACPSMFGESIEIIEGHIRHTTWNPIPLYDEDFYFARYCDVFDQEGKWKKLFSIPDPLEINRANGKLKPILVDQENNDFFIHRFCLEEENGTIFGLDEYHRSPKEVDLEKVRDFIWRKFNSYINVILLGLDDEILA